MAGPQGGIHGVPTGTTDAAPSLDKGGATLVSGFYPDLAEMSRLGYLFTAAQAIAGVAPGTSGTTTTPAFTGYCATRPWFLLDVTPVYVSGTIGAGSLSLARQAAVTTTPTGGTAITAYPTNGNGTTAVVCGTGHTVTALAAANDRMGLMSLNATLATAPAAGIGPAFTPATVPVLQWIAAQEVVAIYGISAAGSSPLIRLAIRFIDVGSNSSIAVSNLTAA